MMAFEKAWVLLKIEQMGPDELSTNHQQGANKLQQGMGEQTLGQDRPGFHATTEAMAYKPDQIMSIAHHKSQDLIERLQQVADHESPEWAGILHDAQSIHDLLDRALGGNKPEKIGEDNPAEQEGGGSLG